MGNQSSQNPVTDPKSDLFIPHDYQVRPRQDPDRSRLESPRYEIDAESICYSDSLSGRPYAEPSAVIEWAIDKISQEGFHLEYVCRSCENWRPTEITRPNRRGAIEPEDSCFGCWFGHLNGSSKSFATTDRDAAYAWWAEVKGRITSLEFEKTQAAEWRKKQIEKLKTKAFGDLKRAMSACKRLGFNPAIGLRPETTTKNHYAKVRGQGDSKSNPVQSIRAKCQNCSAWELQEVDGPGSEELGACWVHEGMRTKQNYWCSEHRSE